MDGQLVPPLSPKIKIFGGPVKRGMNRMSVLKFSKAAAKVLLFFDMCKYFCTFFCIIRFFVVILCPKSLFMAKNTEIERKFLVTSDDFKAQATGKFDIMQGYLCKEPGKTIRVRIRNERAFLTIKSGKLRPGLAKFEWEKEIDLQDARELMQLCLPDPILKERYIIPATGNGLPAGRKWEVDVFHGHKEGLVLAEIELDDENETFDKPGWIGDEVTGLPQYYNANM